MISSVYKIKLHEIVESIDKQYKKDISNGNVQ